MLVQRGGGVCRPLLFVLLLASPSLAATRAPNVVLISVDTLRADALGIYGRRPSPTPFLDSMSGSGVVFENLQAASPVTLPSHASVLTGRLPSRHGLLENGRGVLDPSIPTLADVLQRSGYWTAAVIGAYPLAARFGLDRGFVVYDDAVFRDGPEKRAFGFQERLGSTVTNLAIEHWSRRPANAPGFLFVHYYDPHAPYRGQPGASREDSYLEEVRRVDSEIGRLWRSIVTPETLVVFLSDHGESLGEHGEPTHGAWLYQATMHVPLAVWAPGRSRSGRESRVASHVDIMPTVLDILGIREAGSPPSDGESLWGRARRGFAISESHFPAIVLGLAPLRAIRSARFKLITPEPREVFDLRRGSNEAVEAGDEWLSVAAALERRLGPAEGVETTAPSPEVMRQLRALGYIQGGSPTGRASGESPKEAIRKYFELDRLRGGWPSDGENVIRAFEDFLAKYPAGGELWHDLGSFQLVMRRLNEAERSFRRAIESLPSLVEARLNLANLLIVTGRYQEARGELENLRKVDPRFPFALLSLAELERREGNSGAAREIMREFCAMVPDDAECIARKSVKGGRREMSK